MYEVQLMLITEADGAEEMNSYGCRERVHLATTPKFEPGVLVLLPLCASGEKNDAPT